MEWTHLARVVELQRSGYSEWSSGSHTRFEQGDRPVAQIAYGEVVTDGNQSCKRVRRRIKHRTGPIGGAGAIDIGKAQNLSIGKGRTGKRDQ